MVTDVLNGTAADLRERGGPLQGHAEVAAGAAAVTNKPGVYLTSKAVLMEAIDGLLGEGVYGIHRFPGGIMIVATENESQFEEYGLADPSEFLDSEDLPRLLVEDDNVAVRVIGITP